jgi:hypothetical protein
MFGTKAKTPGWIKKIGKPFRKKTIREYVAEPGNRSWSDNGNYIRSVTRACRDEEAFRNFKRDRHYTDILEHVNIEQGASFLGVIERESPEFLELFPRFRINDRLGNAAVHDYPKVGLISPSTLRYIKVLSDLKNHFGDLTGSTIAEIGVGYGGQLLILDQLWKAKSYTLFDLDPVLSLASRYLESFVLQTSYQTSTFNRFVPGQEFDLVMSNFAFSELPRHLQLGYVEKVLSKAKRGYLTMNSGVGADTQNGRFLSSEELKGFFPGAEVLEDMGWFQNYILVWGHEKK